jgi:hypothetical protein
LTLLLIASSPSHSQFHLMSAEDGSGKGAGLVSAIAQRINSRNVCTTNGNHLNGKVTNGKGKQINGHTNGHQNGVKNGANGHSNGH